MDKLLDEIEQLVDEGKVYGCGFMAAVDLLARLATDKIPVVDSVNNELVLVWENDDKHACVTFRDRRTLRLHTENVESDLNGVKTSIEGVFASKLDEVLINVYRTTTGEYREQYNRVSERLSGYERESDESVSSDDDRSY